MADHLITLGIFGEQRHVHVPDEGIEMIKQLLLHQMGKDSATDDEFADFVKHEFVRRMRLLIVATLAGIACDASRQALDDQADAVIEYIMDH